MKINNLTNQILAKALALDRSGSLKSTFFAKGKEVFIMNYDHTVLIRFRLSPLDNPFKEPISFNIEDYDSPIFEVDDGKVIFHSEVEGYERKKIVGTSDITPEEVIELYEGYYYSADERQKIELSNNVLNLLNNDLSHIEFSGKTGEQLKMIQRNIYTGELIEIRKDDERLFPDTIKYPYGPYALKTKEFRALFSFQKSFNFYFPEEGDGDFIIVKNSNFGQRGMTAIMALSLYDEVIKLEKARYGRKEQKIRRSK